MQYAQNAHFSPRRSGKMATRAHMNERERFAKAPALKRRPITVVMSGPCTKIATDAALRPSAPIARMVAPIFRRRFFLWTVTMIRSLDPSQL